MSVSLVLSPLLENLYGVRCAFGVCYSIVSLDISFSCCYVVWILENAAEFDKDIFGGSEQT